MNKILNLPCTWLRNSAVVISLFGTYSTLYAQPALQVFEPNHSPMRLELSALEPNPAVGYSKITQSGGIVLWGPYVNLPEGDYTAFFTMRSPDDAQRISAEVVHSGNKKDELFAASSISLPNKEWNVVSLDFSLRREDSDKKLEFRLWKNQETPMLHVGSIFVVPKQPLQIAAAATTAAERQNTTDTSPSAVAAWVDLQTQKLEDDNLDQVLTAFRLLTAISHFNHENSVYEYFHPRKILTRLRQAAEGLLQDKKSQFPAEVREEILEHWVSLRRQMQENQA